MSYFDQKINKLIKTENNFISDSEMMNEYKNECELIFEKVKNSLYEILKIREFVFLIKILMEYISMIYIYFRLSFDIIR